MLCPHLCIFVAVPPRILQVLAGPFVAVGVQVDGAGRSFSQELRPDVLDSLCHFLLRHSLQVLHCQPEPSQRNRRDNKTTGLEVTHGSGLLSSSLVFALFYYII